MKLPTSAPVPKRIRKSLRELKKEGWHPPALQVQSPSSYPASDVILLVKEGVALQHMYSVYTDSSDYPKEDWPVEWRVGQIKQFKIWRFVDDE